MPSIDGFTPHGANALARRIERFWTERGHSDVIAFRYEIAGMPGVYGVRSNLVAGRPPSVARRRVHPFAAVAG